MGLVAKNLKNEVLTPSEDRRLALKLALNVFSAAHRKMAKRRTAKRKRAAPSYFFMRTYLKKDGRVGARLVNPGDVGAVLGKGRPWPQDALLKVAFRFLRRLKRKNGGKNDKLRSKVGEGAPLAA